MPKIYEILPNGYLGSVLEVQDDNIIPFGFTRKGPSEDHEGKNFIWQNGEWIFTDQPMPDIKTDNWAEVRKERDRLLKESDWTQLPDVNVDKDAWVVYRQALRDITENAEDSYNVIFPEKP